jgi:hypothetical protein
MANLTGTWLGTYWQDDMPTRFEMSIAQGGNALSGNILDDGNLGEATITGEAIGRNIQFSKRYISISQGNILYQGLLSEDEHLMQGEWILKMYSSTYGEMIDSGRWEATRSENDLANELTQYLAKKKELSLVSGVLQPSIIALKIETGTLTNHSADCTTRASGNVPPVDRIL